VYRKYWAGVAHDGAGICELGIHEQRQMLSPIGFSTRYRCCHLKNWIAAAPESLPVHDRYPQVRHSGRPDGGEHEPDRDAGWWCRRGLICAQWYRPGIYDVWVKCSHWLAANSLGSTSAPRLDRERPDSDERDINGDNIVNFSDYLWLQSSIRSLPGIRAADLNGDRQVNFSDYTDLQSNYKKVGHVVGCGAVGRS